MKNRKPARRSLELDMTPMVDVTFLLLIFFMVTASFSLQRSVEQPSSDLTGTSAVSLDEPLVEVWINSENSFHLVSEGVASDAISEREMRYQLRSIRESGSTNRLTVLAHPESTHSKVIKVWDTGVGLGFDKIELVTTEKEY